MSWLLKTFLMLLGASLFSGVTWGQADLRDPMRPPVQFQGASVASNAAELTGGEGQPVVQVLLIGRDRQSAVIDGRVVKRGEQMDQWRLVNISDRGVVLRDGDEAQTISVHPAVKKQIKSVPSQGAGSKNTNP